MLAWVRDQHCWSIPGLVCQLGEHAASGSNARNRDVLALGAGQAARVGLLVVATWNLH